jgi:hypothetical protein
MALAFSNYLDDVLEGMAVHPIQPERKLRWHADGITIYRTHFPVAGMICPMHTHDYDHVSTFAAGGARVWADGVDMGIVRAPEGLLIKGGVAHRFDIIEDGTILDCIHSGNRLEVE